MNPNIVIGAEDGETANMIQQELTSHRISSNRMSPEQAVRFGMKVGALEASPKEFLEILEAAPDIVDALFDTIQRFRSNLSVFLNGKHVHVPNKQALQALLLPGIERRPSTFEDSFKMK